MEEVNPVDKIQENVQKQVQNVTVSRGIRNYRAIIFQGYIMTVIVTFAVVAVLAHFIPYFPIDLAITRYIQSYKAPWFDLLMRLVSTLGSSYPAVLLVAILSGFLVYAGLRWEAMVSLLTAGFTTFANINLKILVNRQRPSIDLVNVFQQLKDRSFPSGHVMFYTAFFGFLLFLAYSLLSKSHRRTVVIIMFGLLIVLVGPSRIYLGEHWASDVFGAYLLGSLILALSIYFYRWGKPRFFVTQPTASPKKI